MLMPSVYRPPLQSLVLDAQETVPAQKFTNSPKTTLPFATGIPHVAGCELAWIPMSAHCMSCSKVLTATEDVTHPGGEPRWQPDDQLVPAILAGSRKRMADLSDSDRSWVVAGLGIAGLTAEEIAERLKCSLRLVRSVRALPLTRAFEYAQTETTNWVNEARLASTALRAAESRIAAMESELTRARAKLSRMIDAHIVGTPSCRRCGTPWDRGNTYFEGGKRRCRNCNRLKQQRFRERQKAQEQCSDRDPVGGYEIEVSDGPPYSMDEFTLADVDRFGEIIDDEDTRDLECGDRPISTVASLDDARDRLR